MHNNNTDHTQRVKFEHRTDLTPVTQETFKIWLEKKAMEKEAATKEKAKRKMQKKGKKGLTGRELFSLTPNIFKDDDNAEETIVFEKDQQKEDNDDGLKYVMNHYF